MVVIRGGPASVSVVRRWRRRRRHRPSGRSAVVAVGRGRLGSAAFVDGLDQGRFIEQDDPGFGMSRVSSILDVSEVDVSHALVDLLDDAHRNVAVLFVLPVQRIPDDVVRGLLMECGHAQDFVTA